MNSADTIILLMMVMVHLKTTHIHTCMCVFANVCICVYDYKWWNYYDGKKYQTLLKKRLHG